MGIFPDNNQNVEIQSQTVSVGSSQAIFPSSEQGVQIENQQVLSGSGGSAIFPNQANVVTLDAARVSSGSGGNAIFPDNAAGVEVINTATGGGTGIDTNTTYDLIREGNNIILTGSDGTRDSVSAAATSTMPDDAVKSFTSALADPLVRKDFVFSGNFPQTITHTNVGADNETVIATFVFEGNFPRTITYTGSFVDTCIGAANAEFVKTFTFNGNFPSIIEWTQTTISQMALSLTFLAGEIMEVADPNNEYEFNAGQIIETSDLYAFDAGQLTGPGITS